jgi:hypothetical protein
MLLPDLVELEHGATAAILDFTLCEPSLLCFLLTWWSWNMLSLERATAAILAITGRLWITKVTSFFYENLNYNY